MIKDLVSVIIPTFNREELIERAVLSVINQTYGSVEIIVVDDGSTDKTRAILRKYPEVKVIQQANQGVSKARNNGIINSKGEYIALLDSDDEWVPTKLEKQISYLNMHPELQWVHSNEVWIRSGVRVNQMNKHKKNGGDQYLRCLDLCVISPSCTLIKKELLDLHGLFNEEYTVCEDYDLWLRLLSLYEIGFVEESLTIKYGGHEDQLSTKFFAMDYWRIKSLAWVLRNRELDEEKKSISINILVRKSARLLKGYKKHNNIKDVEEIETIMNEFSS
jgi:glycosyltransferase involved in cell wall biosynthesis